jgi:hypothetical protein
MDRLEAIEKLRDDSNYYGEFGKQFISNSDIKTLLFDTKQFHLQTNTTQAMEEGRYFHQLILESEKAKDFLIADVGRRDASYKKFLEENNVDFALKTSEADSIKDLVEWCLNDPIEEKDDSRIEMRDTIQDFNAIYEEPMVGELFGHQFKCKADIIVDDTIIDLKTSNDVARWSSNAQYWGYDTQAYIYQKLFGLDKMKFIVVGKEKKKYGTLDEYYYDVGYFDVTPETLERAKQKIEHALQHYDKHFSENAKASIKSICYRGSF